MSYIPVSLRRRCEEQRIETEDRIQREKAVYSESAYRFLNSAYVEDVLESAQLLEILADRDGSLEDEQGPSLIKDALEMRDVLISIMLITCLRRSKEMATFRLKEATSAAEEVRVEGEVYHTFRVAEHKTAAKGE